MMVFYSTATPSGNSQSPTLPLMFSLHCVMRKNRGKKQRFKGSDKAGCSYFGFEVYGEPMAFQIYLEIEKSLGLGDSYAKDER